MEKAAISPVVLQFLRRLTRITPNAIVRRVLAYKRALGNAHLNRLWLDQDFIHANMHLMTKCYLEANREVQEVEHQVGRYLNMREVVREIAAKDVGGDIVEFGTWQGQGLIFLGNLFSESGRGRPGHAHAGRKFWGIDSFEGLPESSTIWTKGAFKNTGLDIVKGNLDRRFPGEEFQSELVKGWFSDNRVKEALYAGCKKICLVHFDADLGTSTTDALKIVEPYVLRQESPMYFLFDDWGCHPDEVPDAFFDWFLGIQEVQKFQLTKLASTRFTRYYRLDRK